MQLDPVTRDVIDGSGWLQFDDIRHSDWTTESYRHLSPGFAIRVVLNRGNAEKRQLTLRYYDAPNKILEVWAAGQLIGQFGGGRNGSGWVEFDHGSAGNSRRQHGNPNQEHRNRRRGSCQARCNSRPLITPNANQSVQVH